MKKNRLSTALRHTVLILALALFAFPFLWMLLAAFKSGNKAIFSPFPLLPETWQIDGFVDLWNSTRIPFTRQFANTLLIASMQTLGAVTLSVMMGYLFGRYRFRGRRVLLGLTLLIVLIPRQVMLLPLFTWLHKLGLHDTPFSVILPGMLSGIGILYFTQVFRRVPQELVDMARTEGASEGRILLVLMPLIKPALLTYTLIHFILAWNEHLIPFVMLDHVNQMTLTLGLASLHGAEMQTPYNQIMAGSLVAIIPTIALFLVLRRHFETALRDLTHQ